MATKTLYMSNDNVLSCTVLDDDGTADTGATVTAVVVDRAGTSVETGLTLSHTASGVYEVTLDETAYTKGSYYTAQVTVVGSNSEDGYIEVDFLARPRKA